MHDFLLAKEIIDEVLALSKEKGLENISEVDVAIGAISLAHDGHVEHVEDIDLGNLQFGLKSISEKTFLKDTKFNLEKIAGDNWKITNIKIV